MSKIDTGIILDGITLMLHKIYPDSRIHGEEVEQGLKRGDFNVILVTSQRQRIGKTRFMSVPAFDILYYPCKGKVECYAVADNLFSNLELITVPGGDVLRGTDMSFEVVDGVLHFRVNYSHFIQCDGVQIKMDAFKLRQGGESYGKTQSGTR